jgi:alanyl-tRNA synthetase
VNGSEIRQGFLTYFANHQHQTVPSAGLRPHNDPTLYFTNAGMVPFKDVFTGAEQRAYVRAASAQKCLRVSGKHNDLDNVGRTPRHHTFFEMLGNFSFGDYFKAEAVRYAWELLTGVWKIDADRLWVTVFEEDEEALALWRDSVGVAANRIQRLGAKDNFWSMGPTGPCGPCSEIHYDHGAHLDANNGGPATESPRYVEIWNLVFMQFEQHDDGARTALPKPSIDTGMGLERIAAVLQGVYSNYDTDLFQPLIRRTAALAKVKWGDGDVTDTALRVVADHARATAFLVGEGIMPSNEERGYVLRRIMRRGIMFGTRLGLDQPFLHQVVDEVVSTMSGTYADLADRREYIADIVLGEERRFRKTLDRGMKLLDSELTVRPPPAVQFGDESAGRTLSGSVTFKLHDTFGFPKDLTQLIAGERGWSVDLDGFDAEMSRQKETGRSVWKGSGEEAVGALWRQLAAELGPTPFAGYEHDSADATVKAIVQVTGEEGHREYAKVSRLAAGERGVLLLDQTPFYGESGGQAGDSGAIGPFRVDDTTKAAGLILHHGEADEPIEVGQEVRADVDAGRRSRTRRNHTATHLLHAALRTVLGTHVTQKGSLVAPDRLRFDFSHPKPLTDEEISRVEDLVNGEVLTNTAVQTTEDDLETAIARGAMALFGEKYDDRVRVVAVPGFSVELCGGTHVSRTGDIGLFRIQGESGVAAGVRRIEAQTGTGALAIIKAETDRLHEAARRLKTDPQRLVEAIVRLQEDRKQLERQLAELKREAAKAAAGGLVQAAREIRGVRVLAAEFDGDLREQADRLRDQLGTSVVFLVARAGDKVQLLAAASKDIAGTRVHAGKLIEAVAPLVGGRGGGRPDLAQAGGADPSGISAALERAYSFVEETLNA